MGRFRAVLGTFLLLLTLVLFPQTLSAASESAPDLVITNISTTPAEIVPGSEVTVKITVKNQGQATCPAGATVKIKAGAVSAAQTLSAINKNSSKTLTFNKFKIQPTGEAVIQAVVIPPDNVQETTRTNNERSYTPVFVYPDLTPVSITMTPSSATAGSSVTFNVTVKNIGQGACPSGGVLELRAGTQRSTAVIPAISKNSTKTVSVKNFVLPADEPVTAAVSCPAGTTEQVTNNNTISYKPVLVSPDLTITKISMNPDKAAPGSKVKVSVTVKNQGQGKCPEGGKAYLTAGSSTAQASLPEIGVSSSKTVTFENFTLPSTNDITLTARVESPPGFNEVESFSYRPGIILPDLAVTGITMLPSSSKPGETVRVSVNVKNVGEAACPAGGRVGLAASFPGDDFSSGELFTMQNLPALNKGENKIITFTNYVLPKRNPILLHAKVEPPPGVQETSAGNNTHEKQPALAVPVLVVEQCYADGYWNTRQYGNKPALGDDIILRMVLKNTSNIDAKDLPVELWHKNTLIRTGSVTVPAKKTATVEFTVTVPPRSLADNENTVAYKIIVNPEMGGGMPTNPAYIMRDICLDIEKMGSIRVNCYHVDKENDPVKFLNGTLVTLSVRNNLTSFTISENTDTDQGYFSPDSLAFFENIPIGSEFTVTGTKSGYTGFNGRNTYSGTLMSRQHDVYLELTNMGSIAVTAKSQALGTILSGAAVEVVGRGMQKVSTPENPAVFTLPSGQYSFKITKRGYAPTTFTDFVRAGQENRVTVAMTATPITKISGYARDKDNIPIPNQTVKLYTSLGNTEVASAITDSHGFYSFQVNNGNLYWMKLKAIRGNASAVSEPECFWPGIEYRVDLKLTPPPPPPPPSGWKQVARKGPAWAISASVPGTFFTQDWDIDTAYGLYGIRMKYRNEGAVIKEVGVELFGGPAAEYNIHTTFDMGEVLGEVAGEAAQSLRPTMSDSAKEILSFLVDEQCPEINLNMGGNLGRTIAHLDRLEIISRESGEVLWSGGGFNTEDAAWVWKGATYATSDIEWSDAVIRAYIFLDGPAMLGPTEWCCKMMSWDPAKGLIRLFSGPGNHPRLSN
ncbi:MAG: CARDB domain-containing protein [Bacillota bacterium]|nr:CARDB domain-containing protein [Bacillota bacterium]